MGSDIILCMALIASFAFVIQFLLSILGSDLDTDIDIDSASDLSMSLSDIISFKGITHFILGYSWTTYFTGNFLNNVVKTVAPALGVIDQLPIADTLKKLKGDDKK